MRKILPILLCAVMLASFPHAASACRVGHTLESLIAGPYDAVVVVNVTRADNDPRYPGSNIWTAQANLAQLVSGHTEAKTFSFARTGSSCEMAIALPLSGDAWVLYLNKSANGWNVAQSFPLTVVRTVDKRFAR